MTILHTSDWHLGQRLYSYSRIDEQADFLRQIEEILVDKKPDFLLVSGDIYDTITPPIEAQQLFSDAILSMHKASPNTEIIITAGNHDSGLRMDIHKDLWALAKVSIFGRLQRTEEGQVLYNKHIMHFPDKAYIVPMPYVYQQHIPILDENRDREAQQQLLYEAILDEVERQNRENLPVILMAHAAISGSEKYKEGERRGYLDYIPLSRLGEKYDYLALGHIHKPLNLSSKARYCGSPIPVNFDEALYEHSVSFIEIDRHGDAAKIDTIPIYNKVELRTFPEEAMDFEEALSMLATLPDEDMYLRFWAKRYPPTAVDMIYAQLEGTKIRYCTSKINEVESNFQAEKIQVNSEEELARITPLEIANTYYKEHYNEEMPENLQKLMKEVIEQAQQEEQ